MEYTFVDPEEFNNENYHNISRELLRFAKDDKTRAIMEGILYQGGFEEYSVNSFGHSMNRWNSSVETRRRIGMVYLISQYPETFDFLRKSETGLFHGTDSLALPGIIKNGLKSFGRLQDDGERIVSGEKCTMDYRTRNNSARFISMTDDLETALDYSLFDGGKNDGKFGIIMGINREAFKRLKTCSIHSDTVEVGIREMIPPELISFIGVPEDKVELVRKMVGDKNIAVMPMPLDIRDKFYYLADNGIATVFPEISNRLLKQGRSKCKVFGKESFRNLAEKVNVNGLMKSLEKLQKMLSPKKRKAKGIGDESE